MIPTCDSHIWILHRTDDYILYVAIKDNVVFQIWEVIGKCIDIGNCYKGAVGPKPTLDCPVTQGFKDCCPLKINILWQHDST